MIKGSKKMENFVFCGNEPEGDSLNDTTVYITVEKIIKSVCNDYDILKATLLDDNGVSHYVFEISGGKNGNGNWFNYFSDINQIFSILNYKFKKVWLIKIDNDVLDDIHYITFGISQDTI